MMRNHADAVRSNEKALYRLINAGVLAGMILLVGQGVLGTGELDRTHLLTVMSVLAVSVGLNFTAFRGRMLCLSVLLVLFLTSMSVAGIESSMLFIRSFFPWLAGRAAVSEAWSLGYGLVQTGLLTGLCYLAQILFEKLQALKMAAGILAFLTMIFCLLTRRELSHYGVAFQAVFCVITWMEWIQGRWKKKRSKAGTREAHTLWIMPFLALYLVLLAVMPAPEKPYDWQWAKDICERLWEGILTCTRNIKWGSREGFDMAFSGFSEEGELGGGVREKSERMMLIRVDRGAFGNSGGTVYLTGNIYDTFDGRGWDQDWQGYSGEVFWDTAETLYAVRNYSEQYQRDYLREVSLEMRYEDFHTGYLFAPLKTWSVGGIGRSDYACVDGSLRWARRKGYGTEYSLRYFRMNAGQQEFDRFLEEAGNPGEIREAEKTKEEEGKQEESAAIRAEVLKECQRRNGEIVTWDDILLYRKAVYESYLGGVNLSPKVSSYLNEITQTAATDVEKLRAIEKALRSYSYTLTPGELPGWVEEAGAFLDYFLLESRQGYCTYFATAFVLLARAEGIPARYVQGYCVPVPPGGEAYVDSSMAHAWPEAYLEGVGWIPFEPTPGYEGRRYAPWGLEQSAQGNLSQAQNGALVPDDTVGRGTESAGNAEEAEDGMEESKGVELADLWRLLAVGLPALLMVCAVVLAVDHAVRRYRYKRMHLGEKFRIEVYRNLEILSWLGVKKKEWETLQELREKAEALPGLEQKAAEAFRFMEDYEKIVYGGAKAAEPMLEGALRTRETLFYLLKKEKKWAYFYCRIGLFLGRHHSFFK